ncbi:MAG: leucine-rich repeat domain-containing protein [Saprospiraceae bacterium]
MSKRLKIILFSLFLIQMSVFAWIYWENVYQVNQERLKYELIFPDEFADPVSVYKLDLSNQNLTTLPDCFKIFINTSDLNLSNNQLTNLPEWIQDFKKLEKINLSKNNFSTFEVKIPVNKLDVLNLSYNQLSSINTEYLTDCYTLNLSNNSFEAFPDFDNQHYLHHIILSHNNISFSEDERDIDIPMSSVDKLDLSHNNISHLPKISTVSQNSLDFIDFSHNPIEANDFEFGYKIKSISARNSNQFKTQLMTAVSNGQLEKLQYLDLSDNNYAIEISDSNFYSNTNPGISFELLAIQLNNLNSLKLSNINHNNGVNIRHKKLRYLTIETIDKSIPIYLNCERLYHLTVNRNSLDAILKGNSFLPNLRELKLEGKLYEAGEIINEIKLFKQKYPSVNIIGLDATIEKEMVEEAF